ncbi:MAG: AmmeMemoRadiSam system protein A, partial [Clostridiales bacterium]|nr:AmmeMemoRadiSam system protein A [Clostridiales bacterium]
FDGMSVRAEKLSYQDITGVGYGICTFYPDGYDESRRFLDRRLAEVEEELRLKRDKSDAYVRLARNAIEAYVLRRERISVPDGLPEEMLTRKAGVFVSIHKHDSLRGCIGTISPTRSCVAEEIITNAISAATKDPRFPAILPDELGWLEISVDVLGEPEDIESKDELDVKKYGVIVSSGLKKGLLLPDIDGVDTVDQQVDIAMKKAGIHSSEKYKLQRFEVVRHY